MTGQFKPVMTGVRILPGLAATSELLAAAIDAASIDSAARHLLDGADRQSDCSIDTSSPTAQRRSAAPT